MKTVLLLAFCLVASGLAAGADLDISAGVDRTTVALGEQLQLTVVVSGSNISDLPRPRLPWSADFANRGFASAMFSSDSPPGTPRQTIGFMYSLEPKRVGSLTIGPARFAYRGAIYKTQPIKITVTESGEAAPRQERWAEASGVALLGSADLTSVYVGEQITISYTLYARTHIGGLLMRDVPRFTGFWAAKVDDAKELNWRPATCNGQQCVAAFVRQAVLFPAQPGTLTVDRMTLAGIVTVDSGLFKGSYSPFTVSSDPVSIAVKPLPDEGRPADFCGGVGDFKLTASLSRDKSQNGEPLVLQVNVSGEGNVGIIGPPQVSAPGGVKLLAPDVQLQTAGELGRIGGARTFSYSVIPEADGLNVIPAISTSFFSPKSGRYYTLRARPLSFVATGSTRKPPTITSKSGVEVVGSDISHIKSDAGGAGNGAIAAVWCWLFYPLGIAVLMAGAVTGRHRRRLETDRGYARRAGAGRLAKKRLGEAVRLLAAGNERDFYAALSRAVLGHAGDRFNIDVPGMVGEEIRAALVKRGADAATVSQLLDLASRCDAARFSPGAAGFSPRETLDLARSIMEKLQRGAGHDRIASGQFGSCPESGARNPHSDAQPGITSVTTSQRPEDGV